MAINRASIAKELLPGLNAIFGIEYGDVDNEHEPLYEIENSDRAFEEEVLFTGFGTAPVKGEGAAVQYDDAQEGYTARYTAETVALAFAVTEEAMEDNLYDTFAKLRARGLARAMANTKQVKAADVFNNGFNTAYLGGDGVALFAATHPTVGDGNQSNTLGATDLSEASLETALITISKTQDDRGILIGAQAESLHVPSDLAFTADQILNSQMTTVIGVNPTTAANGATNQNALNSVRNQGLVPGGFFVNRRFTDTNAWYLKTDVPNGTKMFVRAPLSTKMEPDFDTGNLRYKARERYSFGWSDWRGFYGASGSS
jgi:hypothetical protein|tara:strand:- start:387 stop:1331 length:945 start_codon:yes stop_codon:yes gene_type:complete